MVLKKKRVATVRTSAISSRVELPVDKLTGALELAQVPFRQREEGRRAHVRVRADPRLELRMKSFNTRSRMVRAALKLPWKSRTSPSVRRATPASIAPSGLGFFQEGLG